MGCQNLSLPVGVLELTFGAQASYPYRAFLIAYIMVGGIINIGAVAIFKALDRARARSESTMSLVEMGAAKDPSERDSLQHA